MSSQRLAPIEWSWRSCKSLAKGGGWRGCKSLPEAALLWACFYAFDGVERYGQTRFGNPHYSRARYAFWSFAWTRLVRAYKALYSGR